MKYKFIDKITIEDGLATGYYRVPTDLSIFKDHFPSFPILPGVLMIEATVQVARILFKNPTLVLKEAKAVRYGSIIQPGATIKIEVESQNTENWTYRGQLWNINTNESKDYSAMTGRFSMRPVR